MSQSAWDAAVENFKVSLPGYEDRQSQTDLAHAMEKALADRQPLLGQAPPGTGKSYPAIIELLAHSREAGTPGVAATATKALQDQYIKDCAFIKEHHDPQFKFVVLKGRGNYLCRSKMAKADEVLLELPEPLDTIAAKASDEAVLGDVERLSFALTPVQKRALTSTSEECPGKSDCAFGKICFAEQVKERAATADVVIVNHALLAVDATLKAQGVAMLPNYEVVVVDEAHELRGYVEGALSNEITERGLLQLNTEVVNFTGASELAYEGETAIAPLFKKFDAILSRETNIALTPAMLVECQEEVVTFLMHLEKLAGKVAVVKVVSDDDADRKKRLRKRVASTVEKFQRIVMDDFSDTVRSLERESDPTGRRQPKIILKTSPLDVAPFLANHMWAYCTPLLISATLAIADPKTGVPDFSYMAKEMGLTLLDHPYQTFDCPTPFDFATQAVTYIPEGMPNRTGSTQEEFRIRFVLESAKLIEAADGRTLLLFTSWRELNYAYEMLAPMIRELGHTVFKQGDMPSTRALADAFAADEHSVCFATKSFFTGVNVVGDSLRCLIIQACPFHYPDVLWQARIDAINASLSEGARFGSQGAFMSLQVPDMVMTLLQGYGRLIRTQSDRGLVAIFDNALSLSGTKRYGKGVRKQLPPAPIVGTLDEAVDALRALEQKEEVA